MKPMIRQPTMGTRPAAMAPSVWVAGEAATVDQRWKKNRFVNRPMRQSSASATKALTAPTTSASGEIGMYLRLVVKSPTFWPGPAQLFGGLEGVGIKPIFPYFRIV